MNKFPASSPPDNHRFVLTADDENQLSICHYEGKILNWWFIFVPERNISDPYFCVEWWCELPGWAQGMRCPRLIIFIMALALVSHRVKSWLRSRLVLEVKK